MGFVDDNLSLIGEKLEGFKIYGPVSNFSKILKIFNKKDIRIDQAIIAIPSAEGDKVKEISKRILNKIPKISILSTIYEDPISIKTGVPVPGKVREITIEDFFRRKPMLLSFEEISSKYKDKIILITGAGGSIGSELCKQLLMFSPKRIILMDSSEFSLYAIQAEISNIRKDIKKDFLLTDLKDKKRVKKIISYFKPEIIFHAAAYKHVPLLEDNPEEAMNNNISSFCNLLCSIENAKDLILISTDKAVDPMNIMGISKRICELIMKDKAKRSKTNFFGVRFGNVAGSSGSVIPLFNSQIEKGGPVTVTHPKMKRFFMIIPEAAQLVLQAPLLGNSGDLFILEMGEQHNLLEIAKYMIRLKGYVPNKDIPIKIINIRKGEKMEETLWGSKEKTEKTKNPRILRLKTSDVDERELKVFLDKIFNLHEKFSGEKLKHILKKEFLDFTR